MVLTPKPNIHIGRVGTQRAMPKTQTVQDGIPMVCPRCSHHWQYRGSKLEEARTASYPVYTSCPRCSASTVRIVAPDAVYQPRLRKSRSSSKA